MKFILLWTVCLMATNVSAQQRRISGTVSDDIDVVIGASVKEIDKNNRIVSATVTDMNAANDQDDLSCDLSNMNCE